MKKTLEQSLPELMAAGLITEDTAAQIRDFYAHQADTAPNRLLLIFGILGALLTGLGVMLVVAHNWDELPRGVQVGLGFVPPVLGYLAGIYVLLRRAGEPAWHEAVATFIFLATGACMALITQIYNLPGALSDFLLGWALMGAPLIFLLRSSMASLLFIMAITWYACEYSYFQYPQRIAYLYWPVLGIALVHYYHLRRTAPGGNFAAYHNWVVPISIALVLGTVTQSDTHISLLSYVLLFNAFYLFGRRQRPGLSNGYLVLGVLGLVSTLFTLSFKWYWEGLVYRGFTLSNGVFTPALWVAALLFSACVVLLWQHAQGSKLRSLYLVDAAFLAVAAIFVLGVGSPIVAVVAVNLLILAVAVQTIWGGAAANNLRQLNVGLLIISLLIACRFFDTDMPFALRGMLFIGLGLAFFFANYRMLRVRA